jgi:hypothetical protein
MKYDAIIAGELLLFDTLRPIMRRLYQQLYKQIQLKKLYVQGLSRKEKKTTTQMQRQYY